jgi:hypothetical protein
MGHLIPGVQKQMLDMNEAASKARKAQIDAATAQDDYAASGLMMIRDNNYDPGHAVGALTHMSANGLPRDEAANLTSEIMANPTPENVKALIEPYIAKSPAAQKLLHERQTADAAQTSAEARKKTADTGAQKEANEAPGQIADATQKQVTALAPQLETAFAQGGAPAVQAILDQTPQGVAKRFNGAKAAGDFTRAALTPEQTTQANQANATLQNTKDYEAQELKNKRTELGQGAKRLAIEEARYGYDVNGGVSPAAQMAADGRMSPQTLRMMLRTNPGLMGQIKTVDPQFDEANIDNRYKTLQEFTNTSTGKAGGQALALNTLIHHADLYLETAEALKNGSFVPGNAIYNKVAQAFGAAPPTNAALVARFFAGETGKVATGGVPAEGEINGILKNLGSDASPDQIAGAGKTLLQIAAGRATPLMERVNNAKLGNVVRVLGPDAQAILARRGFDPRTMKPADQQQPAGAPKLGDTQTYNGATYKFNGTEWKKQ